MKRVVEVIKKPCAAICALVARLTRSSDRTMISDVKEFHRKYDVPIATTPRLLDDKRSQFRAELLEEETREYREAVARQDLVAVSDALADALFVILGTFVVHGVPVDPVWQAVNRANLAKVRDPSGKPAKPEDWQAPEDEIRRALIASGWEEDRCEPRN